MRRNTPHYTFLVTLTNGQTRYVYGPIVLKTVETMQELFDDDDLHVASVKRAKLPPDKPCCDIMI